MCNYQQHRLCIVQPLHPVQNTAPSYYYSCFGPCSTRLFLNPTGAKARPLQPNCATADTPTVALLLSVLIVARNRCCPRGYDLGLLGLLDRRLPQRADKVARGDPRPLRCGAVEELCGGGQVRLAGRHADPAVLDLRAHEARVVDNPASQREGDWDDLVAAGVKLDVAAAGRWVSKCGWVCGWRVARGEWRAASGEWDGATYSVIVSSQNGCEIDVGTATDQEMRALCSTARWAIGLVAVHAVHADESLERSMRLGRCWWSRHTTCIQGDSQHNRRKRS